jgi:hypothetical protein
MLDLKAMAIKFQPNCPVTPIAEFIFYITINNKKKKRMKKNISKLLVVLCSSNTIAQWLRKLVKSAIPTALTCTCVILCSNGMRDPEHNYGNSDGEHFPNLL